MDGFAGYVIAGVAILVVVLALIAIIKGKRYKGVELDVFHRTARPVFDYTLRFVMGLVILALIGLGVGVYFYSQKAEAEKGRTTAELEKDKATAEAEKWRKLARNPNEEDTIIVFWPEEPKRSPDGYLMSDKYIPLRAIARYPNVPMFKTEKMEYPVGVAGIMKAWYPYYVFERRNGAMLLGVSSQAKEADRKWIKENDCFCWTTRECLNIESPIRIYATRQEAEKGGAPVAEAYVYRYKENFKSGVGGTEEQEFQMAALPVLRREEGGYWCFVRPQGSEKGGYQLCWVKWDGNHPSVSCCVRAARREFEEYLAGLRKLMIDWKNPEKQASAQTELYDHGLADMTRSQKTGSRDQIKARQEGIPKLGGFLERPIESPFQYESVSKRAVKMLQLSASDVWDINDVAYIPVEELP